MEGAAATIGAWLLSSLVGGGVVATVGYLALKDRLIRDFKPIFARRSQLEAVDAARKAEVQAVAKDLNNWGSRVNGLETVAIEARTAGDTNAGEIEKLKQSGVHTFERLEAFLGRLEKSQDRLAERQEKSDALINRTVATLDALEKRMDRHSNHGRD